MARIFAHDDATLGELVRAAGHAPVAELRDADVLLLDDDWDALRALRTAGHRHGAAVLSRAAPPDDRPSLERVVLVRDLDARVVARCWRAVTAPR